jgi:hypothetical protein
MIIHIVSATQVELNDRENFKAFKITLSDAGLSQADIVAALTGIATVDADGKTAWVSGAALKNWRGEAQPAEWIASFDNMVEAVKKYGWVNEADGTVRAHIEGAA